MRTCKVRTSWPDTSTDRRSNKRIPNLRKASWLQLVTNSFPVTPGFWSEAQNEGGVREHLFPNQLGRPLQRQRHSFAGTRKGGQRCRGVMQAQTRWLTLEFHCIDEIVHLKKCQLIIRIQTANDLTTNTHWGLSTPTARWPNNFCLSGNGGGWGW